MSRGRRQRIAAAVAAGGGIAFAAGRQYGQRRKVFLARPGAYAGHGAVPQQQPVRRPLCDLHPALPGKPHQRIGNIHRTVAYREYPVAPLGFQRHAQPLKAGHGVLRGHGIDGTHQKAGVAPHRRYEFLRGAVVGHIAAALAGHQYFSRGTLPLFQYQHPQAVFGGPAGRKQSRRAAAHYNAVKFVSHGAEWISSFFS